MRTLAALALALALVACGGAQKPSSSEADTAALESPSSAGEPPSKGESASAATSTPAVTATAKVEAAPAAPAFHAAPGSAGSIDGKPFTPRLAQIAGPMQKDGRLPILIHEGNDCLAQGDAKPGEASMMLMVPWKDGYKVDLASLKRAQKASMGEAAFVRIAADKRPQIAPEFKPTGLVTVVSAPTDKGSVGKMKIDLQSGGYMLTGDLDVLVCTPAK